MNTTEVAVPQPWRDLMQERKDRITALEQKNAKLVAALKAVAQRKLKDGTFCWCGMGYSVEDTHYPFCKQARAVLKELGE